MFVTGENSFPSVTVARLMFRYQQMIVRVSLLMLFGSPCFVALVEKDSSVFRWTTGSHRTQWKREYSFCRLTSMTLCCVRMYRQSIIESATKSLQGQWYQYELDPDNVKKPERDEIDPEEIDIHVVAIVSHWKTLTGVLRIFFECADTRDLSKEELDDLREVRVSRRYSLDCVPPEVPQSTTIRSPFLANSRVALDLKVKVVDNTIPDLRCVNLLDPDNVLIGERDWFPKAGRARTVMSKRERPISLSPPRKRRATAANNGWNARKRRSDLFVSSEVALLPDQPDCVDFDRNALVPGSIAEASVSVVTGSQPEESQEHTSRASATQPSTSQNNQPSAMARQLRIEIRRFKRRVNEIVSQHDNTQLTNIDLDEIFSEEHTHFERLELVACADPGEQRLDLKATVYPKHTT